MAHHHNPRRNTDTPNRGGHHPRHRRDDIEPDGMNADTTGETLADVENTHHDEQES